VNPHYDTVAFSTRREQWDVHFHADAESATIVGLTPISRATVTRLQMNRPRQIAARRR
jgi:hypothetical protein